MKIKTETILTISKFLALGGGVWYCILAGSATTTFVASYINPEWARRTYEVDLQLLSIRDHNIWYYAYAMILTIAVSALKAIVWFVVYRLLSKLTLQTPFSREVERKLERIAFLLFGVWLLSSVFWKTFIYYLAQATGIHLAPNPVGDEYLFIAAMMYIISQVFKRGIEIQEENELTV